jgi:hypothetical protein
MKKIYKYLFYGALLMTSKTWAQCINASLYPSGTVVIANTGTTTVTTCNFGGEYSVNSFTTAGSYIFNGTGGIGNYLTVTNNLNVPIASGFAPLGVVIPSAGLYRTHVSTTSACGTDGSCHTIAISASAFCTSTSQYPGSTIAINATSGALTTITTCNFGGEYSVDNFTTTGIYTVTATGGLGNYITIKNVAGTAVYASGLSPLSFNLPAAGLYRIHLAISAPPACGTDASCHTVIVTAPGAIIIPTAPANDLCANAITLTVPSTTAGTTVNATLESPTPVPCITSLSQAGVWYKVVGNGNQFGADLCATTWDSKIFVFTGTCGAWSCVTDDDDSGPICSGTSASVQWCSTLGTNYYILVTGYSASSAFNIAITQTVVAQPTVVVSASSASICSGATSTLTATGAVSYLWSGTLGTIASVSVSPSSTTVYTVTGTGVSCSTPNVKTYTLTVNSLPTITVNSGAICNGASFTMIPTGASTYTYSSGTAVVTPTTNTSYTVTGTSATGCIATSGVISSVVVNALPVITVNSGTICNGTSFTMIPGGASTYTYSSGSAVVAPTTNTSYTVTGTNAAGCVGTSGAICSVVVNALPIITVNSGAICNGASFIMIPAGASTYTYSSGSAVVAPTTNTSYTVTGTNAAGCIGTIGAVSSVVVNPLPIITVNSGAICNGASFTMIPGGASTYTFSSGSAVVAPTTNTSYTVSGTSLAGCLSTSGAISTVTVNALPLVTASASNTIICLGGSAVLTAASTATTYTWSSGATTMTTSVSPTVTTIYTVTVSDASSCIGSALITIDVSTCTNIIETIDNSISVFPNPSYGIINIVLTSTFANNSSVAIYDAIGKLVFTQDLGSEMNTLNISELKNGMYTFKVLNTDNIVKIGKIVKQ